MKYIKVTITIGLLMNFLVSETALAASVALGPEGLYRKVRSFQEMQRENVVIQFTRYTCGAAALATLINYYLGGKTSESEVIDLTGEFDLTEEEKRALDRRSELTDDERRKILRGVIRTISLLGLRNAALALGYEAGGYRMKLEHLLHLEKPVIVYLHILGRRHFSVLKGIRGNTVFLADPSRGNMRLSVGRFRRLWQNVAMVVTPRDGSLIPDHLLKIRPEYREGATTPNIRILLERFPCPW